MSEVLNASIEEILNEPNFFEKQETKFEELKNDFMEKCGYSDEEAEFAAHNVMEEDFKSI